MEAQNNMPLSYTVAISWTNSELEKLYLFGVVKMLWKLVQGDPGCTWYDAVCVHLMISTIDYV